MRLLGLDFESTGIDTTQARITEIGAVIWDVEEKRPLVTYGVFLYDPSYDAILVPEVVEMMERICGITPAVLKEFGQSPTPPFVWLEQAVRNHGIDYILAHNGNNYDKPLLMAELARNNFTGAALRSVPWLDSRVDLPFTTPPDSHKLKYMAADSGFINPFAHRAIFDVLTMLRVFSQFDINEVVAFSKVPTKIVRALVGFNDKEKAKARRYSWEKVGDQTFPKCWVKAMKEHKVAEEIEECKKVGFQAVVIA